MLEKGAIKEAINCKDQFVSHLFLISKKDGGQRPVNDLNTFIPCKHFKMEGFLSIKENFGTRQLTMQFRPQKRLFLGPLNKQLRKCVRFKNRRVPYTNFFACVLDSVQALESVSLHTPQIVDKNNSIPRRLSDTRENI